MEIAVLPNNYHVHKGIVLSSCAHPYSFQNFMTFVFLWNITEYILRNVLAVLDSTMKSVGSEKCWTILTFIVWN